MTYTLDEAGARELLRRYGLHRKSKDDQQQIVAFALAFASSQAEPKAVGEDVVERVARALMHEASGGPDSDNWCSPKPWFGAARAAIAAMSPSPDTVTT